MKRVGAVILWNVFIFNCLPGLSQGSNRKLSLKQAVETGIANNLQVQQAGLQAQTSEINWMQAKSDRLPNLNGSFNTGINRGRSIDPFTNAFSNQQISFASYGLNSGIILFNGFGLRNNIQQNSLSLQASKMDWQQAKDNLTIGIIFAYLQILNNDDLILQATNQSELTKKQVDRLAILHNDGAITPSTYYDLKGQYANDQLAIINMKNSLETARLNLCQLMNVPYSADLEIEKIKTTLMLTKYETRIDTIFQVALKNFSLIKAVDLRKQTAEKGISVAKSTLFPTLSLNGSANTNYSSAARNDIFTGTKNVVSNDFVVVNGTNSPVIYKTNTYNSQSIGYGKQLNNNLFTSISLNLRIPIFNSFEARNRIKLATINWKNTELIATTSKTQLQQSIDQAYINLTSAWDRYKIILEQVNSFKESFRAADIRFNAGVGNSIDYLTAKNNLDRTEINLITAKYEYVLRTKILDYYQGIQLW